MSHKPLGFHTPAEMFSVEQLNPPMGAVVLGSPSFG